MVEDCSVLSQAPSAVDFQTKLADEALANDHREYEGCLPALFKVNPIIIFSNQLHN